MSALIDRRLRDGRTVADIVFAPLDRDRETLNFVDVGARNGSFLLPRSYAARARLTGFEPNRAEYDKLVNGRTDARAAGLHEPLFREKKYFPQALWSEAGRRTLFLTQGAGAVTLMGPASERITGNMWRENDQGRSFFDRVQRVVATDDVDCMTLAQAWGNSKEVVDILKIDVEGGELDVLRGAERLLADRKILFIYTEVLFLPLYERHGMLGHQQVFLDDYGYRLVALNLDHSLYSWGRTTIKARHDRWFNYSGDAFFMLDPDRNELDTNAIYRLGLACMAMGFNAVGLGMIRQAGMVTEGDIVAIEALANHPPLLRRLRAAWIDIPASVSRALSATRLRAS